MDNDDFFRLPFAKKWRKHSETLGSVMLIFCHFMIASDSPGEWLETEEYEETDVMIDKIDIITVITGNYYVMTDVMTRNNQVMTM